VKNSQFEGTLNFYERKSLELKHSELVDRQRSHNYHEYSLVKVYNGLLFKAFGSMHIHHFYLDTWHKTDVTLDGLTITQLIQL